MKRSRSEMLFEQFLTAHGLPFDNVAVGRHRTPDYRVSTSAGEIIFEVKQIDGARPWSESSLHCRTVGKRIRQAINNSRHQINSNTPAVVLIFNNYDPLQLFHTEDMDFEHAMYGEDTVKIWKSTMQIIDRTRPCRSTMRGCRHASQSFDFVEITRGGLPLLPRATNRQQISLI